MSHSKLFSNTDGTAMVPIKYCGIDRVTGLEIYHTWSDKKIGYFCLKRGSSPITLVDLVAHRQTIGYINKISH